ENNDSYGLKPTLRRWFGVKRIASFFPARSLFDRIRRLPGRRIISRMSPSRLSTNVGWAVPTTALSASRQIPPDILTIIRLLRPSRPGPRFLGGRTTIPQVILAFLGNCVQ